MIERHLPHGSTAAGRLSVVVVPDGSDWHYTGLDVMELAAGEKEATSLIGREAIVVPLRGSVEVEVEGRTFPLEGRPNPWGVTDVLYLPVGSEAVITSLNGAEVAVPWAVAEVAYPVQYVAKDAIATELRGAGICSRQVNNFGTPSAIRADRLIACEVMQPGGNWSSYPPHKHDVDGEVETRLEEIYYYRVAPSPVGTEGFALQRVYASAAAEIDVTVEVRTGDVVTIPFGYHGPTVAAPGHDLYYLNVMAGPRSEVHPDREWLISDDPAHTWIREQWTREAVDPRLPFH